MEAKVDYHVDREQRVFRARHCATQVLGVSKTILDGAERDPPSPVEATIGAYVYTLFFELHRAPGMGRSTE